MSDNDAVSAWVSHLARTLRAQTDELAADLVARYEQDLPPLRDDERMMNLLTESVYQNVETVMYLVEHGIDVTSVDAPEAAFEYARRLAQRGVSVVDLIRAYHIGQTAVVEYAMREAGKQIHAAPMAGEVMQRIVMVGFDYIYRITNQVVAAYEEERDAWLNNRSAVRAARVRSILGEDNVDIEASEVALGYRLGGRHVGVVAWHAVDHVGDSLAELEKLSSDLSTALDCPSGPLFVPCDEASAWVWLPVRDDVIPSRAVVEQALAESGPDLRLAVGEAAHGLPGFRRTHRQALRVQTLGLAAGEHSAQVTLFSEVGSVALMASDLDSARAWVADTLGPLAANDEYHQRLRETLRVFLSSGGSYTSAAGQLTMHKNSVQYRVRKAEELLGRHITDGRMDVELALSLCRWLGAAVLPTR